MPDRLSRRTTRRTPKLAFNHAMIYVRHMGRALTFYRDQLGFRIIDLYEEKPGYARLRAPSGSGTIALHGQTPENRADASGSIRLYFEVRRLDAFCRTLKARGVRIKKLPADMPWGWRHAYVDDPDGHEVSLYWAGRKRLTR